jgi:hypothetical protein
MPTPCRQRRKGRFSRTDQRNRPSKLAPSESRPMA